jgi:hypothetical protein
VQCFHSVGLDLQRLVQCSNRIAQMPEVFVGTGEKKMEVKVAGFQVNGLLIGKNCLFKVAVRVEDEAQVGVRGRVFRGEGYNLLQEVFRLLYVAGLMTAAG